MSVQHGWTDWPEDGRSWIILDSEKAARPYQHWRLAEELSTPDADDVRRGTVIHKLWNAVEVRLRTLHDAYEFSQLRQLLHLDRKSTSLDIMEHLGLVRPSILRRIKDIRNVVEHQDKGAPTVVECATLVDAVWYFLRSTDSLSVQRLSNFDLSSGLKFSTTRGHTQFISFDIHPRDWSIHARGWFWPSEVNEVDAATNTGLVLTLDEDSREDESGALYLSGMVDPSSESMAVLLRESIAVDLPLGALPDW